MKELGLGKWILPQPPDKKEYVRIPKMGRTIPFGYKDDDEEGWLAPIPLELDFLEKAKVFLKQYSMRQVAAWLSTQTGRPISHVGLAKRIKHEQSHKRKASTYRKLTERYEKALRKAEEYEERTGTAQDSGYFHSGKYRDTRESFSRSAIE